MPAAAQVEEGVQDAGRTRMARLERERERERLGQWQRVVGGSRGSVPQGGEGAAGRRASEQTLPCMPLAPVV